MPFHMLEWQVSFIKGDFLRGLYKVRVKKRKPGFDSKFFKIEYRYITKLYSVHDSIIILLSFGTLFIHTWPWMAAQQ